MRQQACSFAACVAVSLCFCLEHVGRQACTSSFMPVRRPACGFYNACVAVSLCVSFTKKKKKKGSKFVLFYASLRGGNLGCLIRKKKEKKEKEKRKRKSRQACSFLRR